MRGSLSVFSAGLTLVSAASHSSFRRERREPAGITKRYTTLTEQYATQALSSDYTVSRFSLPPRRPAEQEDGR